VQRYGLALWAPPGAPDRGVAVTHALTNEAHVPIDGARMFAFEHTLAHAPERALLLERDGGVMLACDCVQNWTDATFAQCSWPLRPMMRRMGFGPRGHIGPIWIKRHEAGAPRALRPDFARMLALPFKHLVTAHGEPVRDTARDDLRACFERVYGAGP
jgi:hypothetical protein